MNIWPFNRKKKQEEKLAQQRAEESESMRKRLRDSYPAVKAATPAVGRPVHPDRTYGAPKPRHIDRSSDTPHTSYYDPIDPIMMGALIGGSAAEPTRQVEHPVHDVTTTKQAEQDHGSSYHSHDSGSSYHSHDSGSSYGGDSGGSDGGGGGGD